MDLPEGIAREVSLVHRNTWRMECVARYFACVDNEKYLQEILSWWKRSSLPLLMLGNGSNLFFDSPRFDGLVIHLNPFCDFWVEDSQIGCSAGKKLSSLYHFARKNGFLGFGFLSLIPGEVGASVVNNAGAHGREISTLVTKVSGFDLRTLEKRTLTVQECGFTYRFSEIRGRFLITEVLFHQGEGENEESIQKIVNHRRLTQPVSLPSCGCVFKNPKDTSAGYLIEQCGLKGKKRGGAEISSLHGNFIVNTGNATCEDVKALMDDCISEVYKKTEIALSREVQFLSEAVIEP